MKLQFLAGAVFLFLAGCGNAADDEIVARAGKLALSRSEVLASINYTSPEDSLTVSAIYIEDWKDLAVLYQLALENKIDKDPDARMLIEKAARHIVVQRFVDRKMGEARKDGLYAIDSSDVRAFYREFPDAFVSRKTEYAVSRYYASTSRSAGRIENALRLHERDENRLLQLIESIEAGYAVKNREARSNALKLRPLERIHPENEKIKEVLQSLSPGELSPVMKVHDSLFVVMEMHDIVKKGDKKTFKQAYEEIEELLIVQKQKLYYSTLLEEARQKYQ